MDLVTIYKTFSSADAHLVRSRLEVANFHAEIAHEISALSMEGYSMGAGGIHVKVPEDQAKEARELLDALNENPPLEEDPPKDS